ncbi:hypothetical protein HN588_09135 [Candidatus Bathyarchaeota archaeon]|jgi:hypothetical protein|nr:hypothetical protein [Candidatus Bathyarchaeota archaeon]
MKYKVLKDVVVNGVAHKTGVTVEITHDKVHRLIMLGYLDPVKTRNKRQTKVVEAAYQEDPVDA